ncbi:anti-sigma-W factor RsiW [Ornithinibacillus gellani]|uniref:anti-sigma-W factor RsiW n=1 Tax=Ornithinibacillus gellani TaxID=2293253 RepID=UPI000F49536B|nr:anti-sigma-W factor RsiW [Ornithinibacillus gellani]TQS71064.1 anti-sigma-W factor RsiW [Ornithinibacillus gellani]
MDCKKDVIPLMHHFLDGDISREDETKLRKHLEQCSDCQKHFHELKRTISWIKNAEPVMAPVDFTQQVMQKLPTEKKHVKYMRWFKMHPVITAAAIFFILMLSGAFSAWQQDSKLTVSKQDDLIIQGDTVIVPEGVTVDGDLVVKNGNLKIEGTVDGNVTLINGKLIQDQLNGEGLMASVGEVNGEFKKVDQVFEWIWFNLQNLFRGVFSFE